MGKSSVIQALLVLRQSFRTGGLLEGRLILGGTLTDLGVGSEVVFERRDDALVGFVLFCDETAGSDAPWAWAFEHTKAGDQLTAVDPDKVARILLAEGTPTAWREAKLPSSVDVVASDAALERIGLPVPEDEQGRYPRAWVAREWRGVPPFGGRVVHVPAERVGPRKTYPLAEIRARHGDFGASGEYALKLPQRSTERPVGRRRSATCGLGPAPLDRRRGPLAAGSESRRASAASSGV